MPTDESPIVTYAMTQIALHPGATEVPHHQGPIEAADWWSHEATTTRGVLALHLNHLECDAREGGPPQKFRADLNRAELLLAAVRGAAAFSAAYLTHAPAWALESGSCLALLERERPARIARIARLQAWCESIAAQVQRARDEVERAAQLASRRMVTP